MQDLFNTHLGAWVYPDDKQDSISVLLLTDQIVDGALDGQWPAPYTFHAAVLDDLLQHRPKAVFIDFYWMNRLKPGSDYLVEVLEAYKEEDIPVYLAAPTAQWVETFWPELLGLVKPVSASVVLDPADFVSRRYPQTDNGLPSAAFAMAKDFARAPALPSRRGDVDIFWGTGKNPKNWAWMEQESMIDRGWVSTFKDGFASIGTTVPYTTTVFVRDLINPVGETEEAAQADLSNHLENRIIIYAASISGIQDYVFLPTRDVLPGAYYHAMAIDNLFTWPQGYKSDNANLPVTVALYLPLWLIQMVFLLPLSVAFLWPADLLFKRTCIHAVQLSPRKTILSRWSKNFKFWGSVLVYVLLVCWFQFSFLDLSVANWIGFVELLGIGVLFDKLNFIESLYSLPGELRKLYQDLVHGGDNEQMDKNSNFDDSGTTDSNAAGGAKHPDY